MKGIDNDSHLHSNGITPSEPAMYVCICNAVTDKMIRAAVAEGATTLADLNRMTGCSGCCGSCADLAEAVLRNARPPAPAVLTVLAHAA
jgi:bacterioferritin-associated ferredoxin